MPFPGHELYRKTLLGWFRAHAHELDVAETLERHKDAVLVLWELDLEPARPLLDKSYATSPEEGSVATR